MKEKQMWKTIKTQLQLRLIRYLYKGQVKTACCTRGGQILKCLSQGALDNRFPFGCSSVINC